MAGEFNSEFHHKSGGGGMSRSSSNGSGGYELIHLENYYNSPVGMGAGDGSAGGLQFFAAQNNSFGPSSSSLLLDSVPGLKHDTGIAVEWSIEEQYKLAEGLAKYANEPNIMQYVKIAASLQEKTVRDVALRCRWMMRKRRKQENPSLGKKVKDEKDKLMQPSFKNNTSSASPVNLPGYSLPSNHNQSDYLFSGVLSSSARHLLEENNHAFGQIAINLSTLKLQENINLFCHTRNNLTTVLNDMNNMPGIMSQMPPLPVLLNEELGCSILPHSSQHMMFGASSSIPLKQEPGC